MLDRQRVAAARSVLGEQLLRIENSLLSTLRHPFEVPYSLRHERLRIYLRHLDVDPVELYPRAVFRVTPGMSIETTVAYCSLLSLQSDRLPKNDAFQVVASGECAL